MNVFGFAVSSLDGGFCRLSKLLLLLLLLLVPPLVDANRKGPSLPRLNMYQLCI